MAVVADATLATYLRGLAMALANAVAAQA